MHSMAMPLHSIVRDATRMPRLPLCSPAVTHPLGLRVQVRYLLPQPHDLLVPLVDGAVGRGQQHLQVPDTALEPRALRDHLQTMRGHVRAHRMDACLTMGKRPR